MRAQAKRTGDAAKFRSARLVSSNLYQMECITMADLSQIKEHMEVIGADGVHVGTVDHVDGDRIKLTKKDSGAGFEGGSHEGHHHYISKGLIADIEGDKVRLSANADVAVSLEEEA